jgi:hypothetical protein
VSTRREFELSEAQHAKLMEAARPVPVMWIGGPPSSVQENANHAWRRLADELGFVWDTVRPVPGKSDRFFTAETRETPAPTLQPVHQQFKVKAEQLVADAAAAGVVITIEQRPLQPLAMRNYETVVSVRPARA